VLGEHDGRIVPSPEGRGRRPAAIAAREGHVDFEASRGRWPAAMDISNWLLFSWKKQKSVLRSFHLPNRAARTERLGGKEEKYCREGQTTTREAS
jgi:hypothetical protein